VPAGDRGLPELQPKDDEDLCYLCGDWRLFQKRKGHRWSLDDLVTAHVAAAHASSPALDLGCGLGSVLLLLAWRHPELDVTGVEAQLERAAMARRSIDYDGVSDRCRVLDGDLRALHLERRFGLITGTPPYFPAGTGTEAEADHVSACRFEHRGGVEAYLEAAERHLSPAGVFVMCAGSIEDHRVVAMRTALFPRRRLHVIPKRGKPPLVSVWTFTRERGPLDRAGLVVRDALDQWTPEFRAVRDELGMPSSPPRAVVSPP
jgi:tRNA1(Val) A37 N6-methylase TrmN6